ncbi:DUF5623 domain-containing protein [Pseudomonas aeruginosa]|uniref:DUF5623 domain-containing protein n=1 Tax=Pseudomonas aeruginosa TaxID=287 RepID=UPI0015E3D4D5|nr:DUF5623 domain-containing protein [Pseudomonas aeruginosa]MBA1286455.1 DUF5623 domain-containing protein [Pseudomonas aeruginosa]
MTSYSSRLSRHLKNQARKLRHTGDVTNQQALDHVAIDFGFTGWKQAHLHMVWADARIRECESSLHLEVASFAEQLRATIGYPYAVDDRVGLRYMPREAQHVESVARRLVYLRLYEQVHAPEYLNRTENAKLWFRPVMSLEDAEDQITIGRMKLQSLAAKFIDPASHSVFPRERVSLTPELVRTRVLTYLHALHSVSLIRHLGARPESILEHPCFRAFVGYALSGLQAHAQLGATHSVVISFAEMSGWAQPGPTQFDPHLLRWVDQPSELPEERQTASLSLEWPAEHASRPPYPLPQDQHRWLAEYLHSIEQLLPKQPSLRKKAAVIRSTLAGWFAAEYGSAAMATEVYFNSAKSYQSKAFLTPAEARKIQDLLKSLRQSVEEGYAPCTADSTLTRTPIPRASGQ